VSLYVPSHFSADDRAAVARIVHDHPFATLVTPAATEPQVTHLPLIHLADCEPHGTLVGHFARTNPHAAANGVESIAIFHGPHAYVSPSWYAAPEGAVPTWNYAVVHAHGRLELVERPEETRAILDLMIQRFEAPRADPWELGLEHRVLEAMVRAIVGFRLRIRRVEAKFKMSQNRSREDRIRVANALDAEPHSDGAATAAWVRACLGPDRDGEA